MVFDTQLFYLLNSVVGRSPFFDSVIVFFASYLPYISVVFYIALVFFSAHSRREKLEISFVSAAADVIARGGFTELIRFFYHRPRPFDALPGVHALMGDPAWSFPSGHATFFFALATVAYLYNKKWGTALFIAATLIVIARVMAGVHYPSDIIGGAIIGVGVGYATFFLSKTLFRNANQTY